MIILQAMSNQAMGNSDSDCLSNLELVGIFLAGVAATAFITWLYNFFKDKNSSIDISGNLIPNSTAMNMISNYQDQGLNDDTASGHLELETIVGYIALMEEKCTTAGKTLSGLEYFFAKYGDNEHPPNQERNTILFYPTYIGTVDGETGPIPFDPDLQFVGGVPVSAKTMKAEHKSNSKVLTTPGWANSNNVLNRTNMSPPREPYTL